MKESRPKLHLLRRKYLFEHTPADRVIKQDYEREYSTFVTDAGGDITQYRVYGETPDTFKCYIK